VAEVQVDPFDVSMLPFEPGATKVTASVPLPNITLLEVNVDAPVPPLATGRAVVNPVRSASHDAAVVPEVNIHVILAVVLAVSVSTKLEPDEFIFKLPEELLCIVNC
jgi:hypothetical protein